MFAVFVISKDEKLMKRSYVQRPEGVDIGSKNICSVCLKIHMQGTTESNTINLRLTCLNAISADRGLYQSQVAT